jgi:hypothetical protein
MNQWTKAGMNGVNGLAATFGHFSGSYLFHSNALCSARAIHRQVVQSATESERFFEAKASNSALRLTPRLHEKHPRASPPLQ